MLIRIDQGKGAAAQDWMQARMEDLLPVEYVHVVFTLPAQIADIAYQNKAAVYGLRFKASIQTLLTIAGDPKHFRHDIGPAHMGFGDGAPPACACHRGRWRFVC